MKQDITPSKIKFLLAEKGWTYADIDLAYKLPNKVSSNAARVPHSEGEKAISKVLQMKPIDIWPSRYLKDGVRRKPQPSENYKQKALPRQRQKSKAA
tara:strand:+ start:1244 stop:1534 length:291 start_codon:yes stop_codon:yes gene_type:complete